MNMPDNVRQVLVRVWWSQWIFLWERIGGACHNRAVALGLYEDDAVVTRVPQPQELKMHANSGYHNCPCRDCFEIAIGCDDDGAPDLCHLCEDAGCDASGESEREVEPECGDEDTPDE